MGQPFPYDEIEMWHGHPDLYKFIIEEIIKTLDDSDKGCFVEVDLRCPDIIKKNKEVSILSRK